MLYYGSAFLTLILQHAWLSISPQDDFTTLNTVHGHIVTRRVFPGSVTAHGTYRLAKRSGHIVIQDLAF